MQPVSCKLPPRVYCKYKNTIMDHYPESMMVLVLPQPLKSFCIYSLPASGTAFAGPSVWILLIRTHFLLKPYLICNQRYKFRIGRFAFSIVHSISK